MIGFTASPMRGPTKKRPRSGEAVPPKPEVAAKDSERIGIPA
jgi:hypothetical protein